jgi:hypothetical protein
VIWDAAYVVGELTLRLLVVGRATNDATGQSVEGEVVS